MGIDRAEVNAGGNGNAGDKAEVEAREAAQWQAAEAEELEGVVEGPRRLGEVKLAAKPCAYLVNQYIDPLTCHDLERKYPKTLEALAAHLHLPQLPLLVRRFLFCQLYPNLPVDDTTDATLPKILGRVFVFHSATAIFYSPSDLSGVGGMHKEIIQATPLWQKVSQDMIASLSRQRTWRRRWASEACTSQDSSFSAPSFIVKFSMIVFWSTGLSVQRMNQTSSPACGPWRQRMAGTIRAVRVRDSRTIQDAIQRGPNRDSG